MKKHNATKVSMIVIMLCSFAFCMIMDLMKLYPIFMISCGSVLLFNVKSYKTFVFNLIILAIYVFGFFYWGD